MPKYSIPWRGENLESIRDVVDAMIASPTVEEANALMERARQQDQYADQNVRYFVHYYNRETVKEFFDNVVIR